jgi:Extensin-like protein C-terminus
VTESAGIVRLSAIQGTGVCGADFPFKVSVLGESAPMAFADDPRPPGSIPSGAPKWPIAKPSRQDSSRQDPPPPYPERPSREQSAPIVQGPISLNPPGASPAPAAAPDRYEFRRPYGASDATRPPGRAARPNALHDDFSPEPYDRRRLVQPEGAPRESSSAVTRAPLREPVQIEPVTGAAREDWTREHARRLETPPSPRVETGAGEPVPAMPVAVNPPATLACPIISELERWITGAVQPAAVRWFGSPVAEIKQISAYSCRGMNGNPRARISEHAFGNALDIAAFTLADGRTITVKNGWHGLPEEQGFLRDVQGAACEQFSTVLAPGSNVYHYDHIHVDLMRHSSDSRICNPHATSGDEVAARAGYKFAGRRGEPSATGSLAKRALPRPIKRQRSAEDDDRFPDRALPLAHPGEDGED